MVFSFSQNGGIFVRGKSIDKRSFGCSLLTLYINSDHSDGQTTKSAMRKECDHMSSHFGLTNKAT